MSISPTPSTSFSFYPEIDFEEGQVVPPNAGSEEEQAESSSPSIPLKGRICAIADRMGYCFYSAWINLPHVMPPELADAQYEVDKKKFFADKPKPFEEIKQRILSYAKLDGMSWEEKTREENVDLFGELDSWGGQLWRKNIELYSDPAFRKAKTKEYADRRYRPENKQENEEEWLVLTLCKQELHDLYRKEPKYLDTRHMDLWMINGHNKAVLAQHRKEWDKLTPSEKAEKIFGKRDKYEIAIAVATAASCFFLCHTMYQFWSSHR